VEAERSEKISPTRGGKKELDSQHKIDERKGGSTGGPVLCRRGEGRARSAISRLSNSSGRGIKARRVHGGKSKPEKLDLRALWKRATRGTYYLPQPS